MRALIAQSWEKATAGQTANYNKKYNYRTFKRGIFKKHSANPSGLSETSQAHKIRQSKWLTPDYQFNKKKKEKNHRYLRTKIAQNIKKKKKKKTQKQPFNSYGRRGEPPASIFSANYGTSSSPGAGRAPPP